MIGAVALAIAFNADSRFQTALPGYTQALQKHIEAELDGRARSSRSSGGGTARRRRTARRPPGACPTTARRRRSSPAADWFNSQPLTLAGLRGKVVLIDFWTYSCINCLRTLPHLKAWYAAYHRDGLVIIGVHTPEFAFEHVASNVEAAVEAAGDHVPGRPGQRVRHLERLLEPVLAGRVPDRPRPAMIRALSTSARATTTRPRRRSGTLARRSRRAGEGCPGHDADRGRSTPESYLGYERLDPPATSARRCAHDTVADLHGAAVAAARRARLLGRLDASRRERIVAGRERGARAALPRQATSISCSAATASGGHVAGKPAKTVDGRLLPALHAARLEARSPTACSTCASRPACRRTRSPSGSCR